MAPSYRMNALKNDFTVVAVMAAVAAAGADRVKFKLDAETRQRGYSVKMRDNGLALLPPRGFMLLVR